jgi:hypothetical protein
LSDRRLGACLLAGELDLEREGNAGLLQQRLGALWIVGGDVLGTVLGVDGRHMGIVCQHTLAKPGQIEHFLAVDALSQGLANPVVGPRLLIDAHADDKGLGGWS